MTDLYAWYSVFTHLSKFFVCNVQNLTLQGIINYNNFAEVDLCRILLTGIVNTDALNVNALQDQNLQG